MKIKIPSPVQTAAWLCANTKLTMVQIMDFCQTNPMDAQFSVYRKNFDPRRFIISSEEISRCEKNPQASLKSHFNPNMFQNKNTKKTKQLNVHRFRRTGYVHWIYINRGGRKICATKASNLIGCRNTTIIKYMQNPEKGMVSHDPIEQKLCTEEQMNNIFVECNCEPCKPLQN